MPFFVGPAGVQWGDARRRPAHRPDRAGRQRPLGRHPRPSRLVPRADAGLSGTHRQAEPALQRPGVAAPRGRTAGRGRRPRRRAGARPFARLAARHSAGYQGPGQRRRSAHHPGLAADEGLHCPGRRPDGRAHEGGRLHRHRQEQHARIRPRLAHLQRTVRHHAECLRSGQVGRRLQRRRRRGAGAAPAAGGRRLRLHGQPAQPGGLEQPVWPAPVAGPGADVAGAGPVAQPAGHRRAHGPQRAGRGATAGHAGRLVGKSSSFDSCWR